MLDTIKLVIDKENKDDKPSKYEKLIIILQKYNKLNDRINKLNEDKKENEKIFSISHKKNIKKQKNETF